MLAMQQGAGISTPQPVIESEGQSQSLQCQLLEAEVQCVAPGSSSRAGSTSSSSRAELGRFADTVGSGTAVCQELGQAVSKQLGLLALGTAAPFLLWLCAAELMTTGCILQLSCSRGTNTISRPCAHCNMLSEAGSNVTLLGLPLQPCNPAGIVPVPVGSARRWGKEACTKHGSEPPVSLPHVLRSCPPPRGTVSCCSPRHILQGQLCHTHLTMLETG